MTTTLSPREARGFIHVAAAIVSAAILTLPLLLGSCNAGSDTDSAGASCDAGFAGSDCEPCPSGTFCDGSTFEPTPCPTGTWDDDGDSSSDCVAWTECAPGELVVDPPTRTSDRVCASCDEGTYSTVPNAQACVSWSVCQPGTSVDDAGTSTSDRTCVACPTGTFSAARNLDTCKAWTDCEPGTYVDNRGSPTRDRTCGPCPIGQTTTTPNAQVCTDADDCPAGTAGPDCDPCDVGTYCAGGTAPELSCASGTWDHDANPASACEPWTDCVAGQQVASSGTTIADRTCETCPSGTWSASLNTGVCQPWATCAPGTRVTGAGSTTANRTCGPCAAGTFSTSDNATTCDPWSDCAAGSYVSTTPTASRDRACTACGDGTFTAAPNTSTCRPFGTCPAGTVQTAAGTATSDVSCDVCDTGSYCAGGEAPAEPCASGTWDHDANPATACEPWSSCGPGTALGADGDATTDRACDPCASGTFSDTTDAEACEDWSTCAPGTRIDAAGTASTDQTCATCAAGTFSSTEDASSCDPWTDCGPGTYVLTAGTPSSDRVCDVCEEGFYSETTNASDCVEIGTCAPGTVQIAPGDETNPPVCEACEAGTYCAGGENAAEACASGTWDHDANPASPCEARSTCAPGTFVEDDGDALNDRTCTTCEGGTFTDGDNAPSCTPWTTCDAGTFVELTGTGTRDRTCTPCEGGTFTDAANQTSCDDWSDCAAGTFVEAEPTASSDRTCTACDAGFFSDASNASACDPWTTCAAGTFVATAGSDTADRVCDDCAPGSYTGSDNLGSCAPWTSCEPGTYVQIAGSAANDRTCTACDSGSFTGTANLSSCTPWQDCEPGTYVEVPGSDAADRTCTDCPPDTTTDVPNASECVAPTECPPGTVETAPEQCDPCVAGEYCAGGSTPAVTCASGTWDDDSDPATVCVGWQDCGAGTRVLSDGTTTTNRACETCASGTWSTATNAVACVPWTTCEPGTYVATAGDEATDQTCADCEPGTFTDADNQSACAPWSSCSGLKLDEGSVSSDVTCADVTPCVDLVDEDSCLRSLVGCTWDGAACSGLACSSLLADPDLCSRIPGCEYGYGTTFTCSVDPSPPETCGDVLNAERCINIGLGCDWDTDGGTCVDIGPPTDCVIGDFGEWSECSRPCDGGTRFRAQSIVEQARGGLCAGSAFEEESCNTGVTCTCGLFTDEFACGAEDGCTWNSSGGTCEEEDACGSYTDQGSCDGDAACAWDLASDTCVDAGAPRDCVYGAFGDWTACSVPCEAGEQSRTRTILQDAANGGSACDPGSLTETQACFTGVECVCAELPDSGTCDAATNCAWGGSSCAPALDSCTELPTDVACLTTGAAYGCIWIGTECIDGLGTCFGATDQPTCESALGCNWNGSTCVDDLSPPAQCADIGPDEGRCEAAPLTCTFDVATQTCQDAPGTTTICSNSTTQTGCDALPGCLWFLDSECITAPSPPCIGPDQASCEFAGACDWNGSSCVADPDPTASCFDLSGDPDRCNATQLSCVYDAVAGVCRDDSVACTTLVNATDCEGTPRCDWDAGACAEDPTPPATCADIGTDADRCTAVPFDCVFNGTCEDPVTCSSLLEPFACGSSDECTWDLATNSCVDETAPLDCVVGDFGGWSSCSAGCTGDSTRTRPVLQDAANGGAACPALSETRACTGSAECICSETYQDEVSCDGAGPTYNCEWLALIDECGLGSDGCTAGDQASCEAKPVCDWSDDACVFDNFPPTTCADVGDDEARCGAIGLDCAWNAGTSACEPDVP